MLLANLRPGATERMGIGPDALKKVNPRLIETHVTGYGWTGPYAHRPGIDPLAQALMGLERAQGGPENPPVFPAQLAPTDFTAGAMGTFGTVLALLVRERTGVIQRVDTNLINAGVVLSSEWFTKYSGKPPRPLADKGQYGLDAFHRLYQAADGWVYAAADTSEQRAALCAALDREDLAEQAAGDPVAEVDSPLGQELSRTIEGMSLDDCLERLGKAGVPCAPSARGDSEVFFDDPHAGVNEMVAAHDHPTLGRMRVARHYIRFGRTEVVRGQADPAPGRADARTAPGRGVLPERDSGTVRGGRRQGPKRRPGGLTLPDRPQRRYSSVYVHHHRRESQLTLEHRRIDLFHDLGLEDVERLDAQGDVGEGSR